jgi:hypothetical protein
MIPQSAPAMLNFLRLLLLLSLALLASTACRKTSTTRSSTVATPDTLIPGTFITTSGKFTHTEGRTIRSLDVTQSGRSLSLDYRYLEEMPSGGTSGSTSTNRGSISSPTDPWFIYVESPERFWLFDGKSVLRTFHPEDTTGPVISSGKVDRSDAKVPAEVILRLPAELQKLLPPVVPPVKRPSL